MKRQNSKNTPNCSTAAPLFSLLRRTLTTTTLPLALVMRNMPIHGRLARKHSAAARTRRFRRRARLLALVPQQVAVGGEEPAIAAMIMAARLLGLVDDADAVGTLVR